MAATGGTGDYDKCGGPRKHGKGPCTRPAGWGTDHPGIGHCKLHLGTTATHRRAAQVEMARRECLTLGLRVEIHPAVALLEEIFRTQANVDYFEALVAELPSHPDDDEFVEPEGDGDGWWIRGDPGVYGRTYHVSGVPTGEAKPHVLYVLYMEERKHLKDVTVAALKAGVDAARVKIARDQATQIADGFRAFAVALGHDPAAPEVREAFGVQLRAIAGGRAA